MKNEWIWMRDIIKKIEDLGYAVVNDIGDEEDE